MMFQQETDKAPMSNGIEIDPKSKETVCLSDYDVPLSQLSETALMKPSAETFFEYNYFTKNRQSQVYETHKENAATKDLIWLLCYLDWSRKRIPQEKVTKKCVIQPQLLLVIKTNSLSATVKVSETNVV